MADVPYHNQDYDPVFGDYVALLKPRVMSLVVFTAFVGLMAAPVSLHPVGHLRQFYLLQLERVLLAHLICGGMRISTRSCAAPNPGQFRQGAPLLMRLWVLGSHCPACLS